MGETVAPEGLNEDDAAARECGLALLAASTIYEDFIVPRREGFLGRRGLPHHVGPTIGFVARERRFLRGAYILADNGCELEAEALLRSLFDFLVCQEWVALDPTRNLALLVQDDQRWKQHWTSNVKKTLPGIESVVRSNLSPVQREEVAQYEAALPNIHAYVKREIGEEEPSRVPNIEQRAAATGLDFLYLVAYRSASHLSHPSMYAIDAVSEMTPKGLRVTATPPPHRRPRDVYVKGALLLREALDHAGRQWPRLHLDAVDEMATQLLEIQRRRLEANVPGWRGIFGEGASSPIW